MKSRNIWKVKNLSNEFYCRIFVTYYLLISTHHFEPWYVQQEAYDEGNIWRWNLENRTKTPVSVIFVRVRKNSKDWSCLTKTPTFILVVKKSKICISPRHRLDGEILATDNIAGKYPEHRKFAYMFLECEKRESWKGVCRGLSEMYPKLGAILTWSPDSVSSPFQCGHECQVCLYNTCIVMHSF